MLGCSRPLFVPASSGHSGSAAALAELEDVARNGRDRDLPAENLEQHGLRQKRHRALLRVQDGCDQFCTFCIVPYTRGEERSRTIPDIVSECRKLIETGVTCVEVDLGGWDNHQGIFNALGRTLATYVALCQRVSYTGRLSP